MTTDLALSIISSLGFSAGVVYVAIARRHKAAWKAGVLLLSAIAGSTMAHAFQILSSDFAAKVFWYKMIHLGFAVTPTAFLVLALHYSGLGHALTRRTKLLLSIFPVLTAALVLTNEIHGLMWNPASTAALVNSAGFKYVTDAGIWYWPFVAHCDLMMVLGCFFLVRSLVYSKGIYSWQYSAIVIAAILGLLGTNLDVFHISPFPPFVSTVVGIAVGTITATFILSPLRRRDTLGVSRGAVFKNVSDGIIVVDENSRIVDVNPAAERLMSQPASQAIGRRLEQTVPELKSVLTGDASESSTAILSRENALRTFEVRVSAVRDWQRRMVGHVIQLRDITERIQAEEDLRRATEKAHAILWRANVARLENETQGIEGFFWDTRYLNLDAVNTFLPLRDYDRDDFARRFYESRLEENGAAMDRLGANALRQGAEGYAQEFRLRDANGNVHWMYEDVRIRRLSDTQFEVVGVITDITDRKRTEEVLRENEEKFRRLFDIESDALFLIDRKTGEILEANDAAASLYGYSKEELLRKCDVDLLAESNKEPDAMIHNASSLVTSYHRKNDGTMFPVEISESHFEWHGRTVRLAAVRDISERLKAHKILIESERRFHTLSDISPVGIFLTDADGFTLFTNPRWCEIVGLELSQALGTGWLTAVHPDDVESVVHGWNAAVDGGNRSEKQYRFLRPDGGTAWVLGQAVPEYNSEGSLTGYVGTITDITKLKQAEEALKLSEEQYRNLYENAAIGIYRTTPDGKILSANPHLVKMLGYCSFEELATRNLEGDGAEPGYDREKFKELLSRDKEVRGLESVWLKHDGTQIYVRENVRAVCNGDGTIAYYDGTAEDITEQKKLQSELLQSQKMDAIGKLAGGVAHDHNNMIAVILGYATLLEEELDQSEPAYQKVKSIITAAERSANLTKQLLAFARRQVAAPVLLNINDELSSLQKILGRLIGENIHLKMVPGDNLWNVKIDPIQIDQIVTNLSTNARDAIENVGTITIETSNVTIDESFQKTHSDFIPGDYVVLTLSDTGKGMDAKTLGHIYEPFFTTKSTGSGTGLGLATVFGIVKQNNGFIHVYSEVGIGTTFKIYLPRQCGEAEPNREEPEEIRLTGTETILIVEDEEDLLYLAVAALESYGYNVLSAKSPKDAVTLCRQFDGKIDLLITDVIMPEMNGKQLQEQINTLRPHVKTLFISGYTADIVAQRGVIDEGTSFLEKPFTPLALAKKVRSVLET